MTVYSLLEEQPVQKKPTYKAWYVVGLSLTAVALAGYFMFTYQHIENDQDVIPEVNTTIPVRSINFTVPTQEQLYFVDLDKYNIEDHIIQAFQKNTADSIKQITIDKLMQLYYRNQTIVPWSDRWLSSSSSTEKTTFSCDNQPLPYPIVRHLATEYFPLKNADSFYDDDDKSASFNYDSPTLILPFAKQPKLVQGQELCIRIVVPFKNVGKDDIHRLLYRPYPQNNAQLTSPWWDTMMTSLTDIHTNASIPIHMQPWREHHNLRQRARQLNNVNNQIPEWTRLRDDELYERERTHIYEAQVILPQEGSWELSSILEFVEARYNFEYGPVSPYKPIQIPVFPTGLQYINISSNSQNQNPIIPKTDQNSLKEHLALPLCKGFDNPGRWLPFPENNSLQDALVGSQLAGLTRDGKYWAPYSCRLRHLSYEQFNRCASKKYARGMNLYGDSNIRRSIKKFLSHGQWCKGWENHITQPLLPDDQKPVIDSTYLVRRDEPASLPPLVDNGDYNSPKEYRYTEESQTRNCYCEDFSEPHWNKTWFDPMARRFELTYSNNATESKALGITEWDDKPVNGSSPHLGSDRFSVSSYKWDGLTYLNIPGWDTAVPSSPREVDVAIFSLGNWDAAFAELEPFLKDVDRLIRQIKEFYDLSKVKIIYRTAQYYCCRIDVSGRTRQVSGPRLDSFEQEVRNRFVNELKAEIWDTYTLGESKTWDEKTIGITCPSNHVPADQVEIENQILMNGLCNF